MVDNNKLAMLAVDDERAFIINLTSQYVELRYPEIYNKFLVGFQISGKFFDEREQAYKDAIK